MRKFAFFDIDGTLTSELDGHVPQSAAEALKSAQQNGHKLFLCSGRCQYNIEQHYFELGMCGAVMGCGTHVLADGKELYHFSLTPEQTHYLIDAARSVQLDFLLESKHCSSMDPTREQIHPIAVACRKDYMSRGVPFEMDIDNPAYYTDKMCIYSVNSEQRDAFFAASEAILSPIERGNGMYEMVPCGLSKATGIQRVLEAYGVSLDDAYVFGDSKNDQSMFDYVPKNIVMGNAYPASLKDSAWFVAPKASEDGLAQALQCLGFI